MTRVLPVSNQTAGTNVPDDVYKAEVVGLQEKQLEWDGVIQNKIEIAFKIVDDAEYEGEEVRGLATLPARLTPKTKLRTWIQAIIGRELSESESFDLDALIGRTCRVRTTQKEGRQGGIFTNVTDVLPARVPRNGQAQPQPQQQAANY